MRSPTIFTLLLPLALLACDDKSLEQGGADTGAVSGATDADGDGVTASEDCDDSDSAVFPGAEESCNGVDDDCDGEIDEDVTGLFYDDLDGDGFGDPLTETEACDAGAQQVDNPDDCDDANATAHPNANETCNDVDDDCDGEIDEEVLETFYLDADTDGHGDASATVQACDPPSGYVALDDDCNDLDSEAFPGATEICDGDDEDCDGEVDEGTTTTYWVDGDGDGYGSTLGTLEACSLPVGYAGNADDCDDTLIDVNPGATELCNTLDDDCDGATDEDDAADAPPWYTDADSDGFGDPALATVACEAPSGTVADNTDCDDTDAAINPNTVWYIDYDSDGFGSTALTLTQCAQPTSYVRDATDCDDSESTVNPASAEVCNGWDDDCDGDIDSADATLDTSTLSTFYTDADSDGYGDSGSTVQACSVPAGAVSNATDCDDTDATLNPDTVWYLDSDSDGYGSTATTLTQCTQPASYVRDATDCDDSASTVNPAGSEVCNGWDDDCDGAVDSADTSLDTSTLSTYYTDADNDGYGTSGSTVQACSTPSGAVSNAGDCDDSDATVNPGEAEQCDAQDNDCDGAIDEGLLGVDTTCPALSCDEILTDDPSAGDGAYYLDPDGNGAFLNYCDMSTNGGGWTLVFACDADDASYGSGWNGWWRDGLTTTLDDTADRGKSIAYDESDVDEIRITATYPNDSTLIFAPTTVLDDLHDIVTNEITTCSGLTGSGRYSYTASTRSGSYWQSSSVHVVVCDTDGSSLETTSAGNHDAAIFSTYTNHGDHNYADGTLGTEFTCAGSRYSYGIASNTVRLWVR